MEYFKRYINSHEVDKKFIAYLYPLIQTKDLVFIQKLLEEKEFKHDEYSKLTRFYFYEEKNETEHIIDLMLIFNKKKCYRKNIFYKSFSELKRGKR